jgi:hypothetical protein
MRTAVGGRNSSVILPVRIVNVFLTPTTDGLTIRTADITGVIVRERLANLV